MTFLFKLGQSGASAQKYEMMEKWRSWIILRIFLLTTFFIFLRNFLLIIFLIHNSKKFATEKISYWDFRVAWSGKWFLLFTFSQDFLRSQSNEAKNSLERKRVSRKLISAFPVERKINFCGFLAKKTFETPKPRRKKSFKFSCRSFQAASTTKYSDRIRARTKWNFFQFLRVLWRL